MISSKINFLFNSSVFKNKLVNRLFWQFTISKLNKLLVFNEVNLLFVTKKYLTCSILPKFNVCISLFEISIPSRFKQILRFNDVKVVPLKLILINFVLLLKFSVLRGTCTFRNNKSSASFTLSDVKFPDKVKFVN